jgi:hypothetical protein
MVKFKVGFTMSAETLFGIIAKFLPVEDMSVEEVPERVVAPLSKIARQVAGLAPPPKPKHPPQQRRNRHSGPSLEGGVNAVILRALDDGHAHRYGDLKKAVGAAGYAPTGIGSKLSRLRELNVVHQPELGFWQIGEAKKKSA